MKWPQWLSGPRKPAPPPPPHPLDFPRRMVIKRCLPPVWEEAKKALPDLSPNSVFAYGDTIYYARNYPIPPDTIIHEEVHGERQRAYPGGVEDWWKRYLVDIKFRIREERIAFGVQLDYLIRRNGPRMSLHHLKDLSGRLSGGNYDYAISQVAAAKAIYEESLRHRPLELGGRT